MKCENCGHPQSFPMACLECGALFPIGEASHFAIFNLPEDLEIDLRLLEAHYLALSRQVHPDHYLMDLPQLQLLSHQHSTTLNSAYQMLRDPYLRACYLLKRGGQSLDSKKTPPGFLEEMFQAREKFESSLAAKDVPSLEETRKIIADRSRELFSVIGGELRAHRENPEHDLQPAQTAINMFHYLRNLERDLGEAMARGLEGAAH